MLRTLRLAYATTYVIIEVSLYVTDCPPPAQESRRPRAPPREFSHAPSNASSQTSVSRRTRDGCDIYASLSRRSSYEPSRRSSLDGGRLRLIGGAELSGRPQNRAKAAPHDCPVDATRPCPHPSQATGYHLAAPSRTTITGAAKRNSCKSHAMLITCSRTPNDATGSSHSIYAPPTYLIGF